MTFQQQSVFLRALQSSLNNEEDFSKRNPDYIEQIQLNSFTEIQRENLIIWIIEIFIKIEDHYNTLPKISFRTKELAIIYLDIYLSQNLCSPENFEALGKERFPITLSQFGSMIDNKEFEVSTLQQLELQVLESLDWNLNFTTPGEYARNFIKYAFTEEEEQEVLIMHIDDYINICITKFKFSEIALTCIALTLQQLVKDFKFEELIMNKIFQDLEINNKQIEKCFQTFSTFVQQIDNDMEQESQC